jgi:tRNA(Ile)-lysidine synthase
VFLDADAAGALLRIRPRRPGDRFRPLGMTGKKKVQDLLVDRKVPRWERARVPILVDAQDRILWVVGQRVAEVARVGETTTRAVRLRVRPVNAAGPEGPFA